MSAGLLVVHPGLSTTIQDRGRVGFRSWGVPVGGVFDPFSSGMANALLGNDDQCAVLEFTLVGGTYEAIGPIALALAGAPMEARVARADGRESAVRIPSAFPLGTGDRLILGGTPRGARTYLAVQGGWQTPLILGSRSTETRISVGDRLECFAGSTPIRHIHPPRITPTDVPIRVIAGPDSAFSWNAEWTYRVEPESNRMGLRLKGPPLPVVTEPERISTPVAPGALQSAGGQPLLLGVACGTMGGYPHVAHVISCELDRVGQLRAGDRMRFTMIEVEEARRLDRDAREERARMHMRIHRAVRQ